MKKRSLVSLKMCFLGWSYELLATLSAGLTPTLQKLGVPNMHLPDVIAMFVVIPFVHLMNDENTKTVVLEEGWYQAVRHMLGIYIEPPKNLKAPQLEQNAAPREQPVTYRNERIIQLFFSQITKSTPHQNSNSNDDQLLFCRRLSGPLPVTLKRSIPMGKSLLQRQHSF